MNPSINPDSPVAPSHLHNLQIPSLGTPPYMMNGDVAVAFAQTINKSRDGVVAVVFAPGHARGATPSSETSNAFLLNVLMVDRPLQVNDGGGVLDPLTAQQSLDQTDQLWLHSQVDHCLVKTNHWCPSINSTLQAFDKLHLVGTNWRSTDHLKPIVEFPGVDLLRHRDTRHDDDDHQCNPLCHHHGPSSQP